MEYYVYKLPTHVDVNAITIDLEHNVAAIPNKGEAPITITYTRDIGTYVAALLSLDQWDEAYYIVGDVKTWNEILAAAEAGKGQKFTVEYDSLDKLKRGEVTELPSHAKSYEMFGGRDVAKPMLQGMLTQFAFWQEEGLFKYNKENGTFLNDVFPDIKALTLKEAWALVGKTV
jgi:hypothetical protein